MVCKMQGSAADLAKKAMIEIHNTFKCLPSEAGQLQPRLLLQIHDELLFEVPGPPLILHCRPALTPWAAKYAAQDYTLLGGSV